MKKTRKMKRDTTTPRRELRFSTHAHTHCFDCFIWSPTSFFLLLKRSVHLRIKSLEKACEPSLTSPQLRRDRTQHSGLYSRWRARQRRIHSLTDSAILDCGERITCRVPGACPPEAGAHSLEPGVYVLTRDGKNRTIPIPWQCHYDSFKQQIFEIRVIVYHSPLN